MVDGSGCLMVMVVSCGERQWLVGGDGGELW